MLRTVASFGRQWEADLAIAFLRENDLHPGDLQTFSHATLAGAEGSYYVVVPTGEAAAARTLLADNGYGNHLAP